MIVSGYRRLKPLLLLFPCLLTLGCSSRKPEIRVSSLEEIAPDTLPGRTADLVLAGTAYPVTLELHHKDDIAELDLVSHGATLEAERYEITGSTFSLLDAAEEHFKPGIPLLKTPFQTGDSWTWKGTMTTGLIPRNAWATVSAVSERLYLDDVAHDTIKSTVDLSFDADVGRPPLKRQLVFWFEPKTGIVKREFGTASVRQPSRK